MGDIQRKLGRLPESEEAYRKAIEMLEPLAGHAEAGREAARAWPAPAPCSATSWSAAADKGQAGPLYKQALRPSSPWPTPRMRPPDDRLHLGQTLKSQGDLLRLNGKLPQAKPVYDQAIAVLEQALAADRPSTPRSATSWRWRSTPAAGSTASWATSTAAERRLPPALELLEKLVAEFPTVPRYRESLAKACNSLGLLEETTGRLADAETFYRRELPLVERLAKTSPTAPSTAASWPAPSGTLATSLPATATRAPRPSSERAVVMNRALEQETPRRRPDPLRPCQGFSVPG